MKLMPCPLNGLRDVSEFAYGGEVKTMPDPVCGTERDWAEYRFMEANPRGVVLE